MDFQVIYEDVNFETVPPIEEIFFGSLLISVPFLISSGFHDASIGLAYVHWWATVTDNPFLNEPGDRPEENS